jgi:tetratricopeptide (TPR) repeat protein
VDEADSIKAKQEELPEDDAAFERDIERSQRVRNLWYLNPVELAGELWDFFSLWRKTRNWRAISFIIPPLLLLFTLGGFILAGKLKSRESLREWYKKQAFEAVGLGPDGLPKENEPQQVASRTPEEEAKIDLLFKRILQLGNEDQDARYFVAWNNARMGKTAAARSTMETLAPKDRVGLDLAHAWLAEDLYRRSQMGESISIEELEHHLANAIASDRQRYSPLMYALYAKILEQKNQIDAAARILTKGAEKDPALTLEPALVYTRHGMQVQAKFAADSVISRLKKSLAESDLQGKESAMAVLTIARAFQLTNRPDESIPFLQNELRKDPSEPQLRRCLSDAFRLKFRMSLNNANGKGQVVIDFLNAAIVADPTNLEIQSELGILRDLGISRGESNLKNLRTLIAQKGASHTARLVLAEAGLMNKEYANSLAHYEVVLSDLPNMVIALNNAAMICLKTENPNLAQARDYISRALAAAPGLSELLDSQGDIEAAAKNFDKAKESYLEALNKSPERISTREKLVSVYVDAGNEEEAQKQRDIIKLVQERLRAIQQQSQQAQKNATATESKEPPPKSEQVEQTPVEPADKSKELETPKTTDLPKQ